MKLPFSLNIWFWVAQIGCFFCMITIFCSTLPNKYVETVIKMFGSLAIPKDWHVGAWTFAFLCAVYLFGGKANK